MIVTDREMKGQQTDITHRLMPSSPHYVDDTQ